MHRHDLVWLANNIDVRQIVTVAVHEQQVCRWIKQEWPMVVTRQPPATSACGKQISIGFTLPPNRTRIALQAPLSAIIRHSRPLKLMDAIDHAPRHWRNSMLSLQDICHHHGVQVRIYGSLSSQILTGMNYLDQSSDLDLLLECSADTTLIKFLAALEVMPPYSPRIDGEILLSSGWSVAWRELLDALRSNDPHKVLAKSNHQISMIAVEQLCANFCSLDV